MILHGAGTGTREVMELSGSGNLRLLNLFDDAAAQIGLKTERARDAVDLRASVGTRGNRFRSSDDGGPPTITLGFEGWDKHSGLPTDSVDMIDPDWMEQIGKTLSTALMVIGQEEMY